MIALLQLGVYKGDISFQKLQNFWVAKPLEWAGCKFLVFKPRSQKK